MTKEERLRQRYQALLNECPPTIAVPVVVGVDKPAPARKSRARKDTWKSRHPLYSRMKTGNYRARQAGLSDELTVDDLQAVFDRDNSRCVKCGATEHLVLDHIKSLYRGGRHTVENLQVLCRICNMEKGVG